MNTEQRQPVLENNNLHVTSIVHDLDRMWEKKAQKRENTLISFAMKAIAREQEKNIVISRLQRELAKSQGLLHLLEIENDVKEKLLKEKEAEIEELRNENLRLKNAIGKNTRRASLNLEPPKQETPSQKLVKEKEAEIEALKNENLNLKNSIGKNARRASLNLEAPKQVTPSKAYRFSDVISTQNNIVASPSGENLDLVPSSNKAESTEPKVDSSKSKVKIVKKKSIKKTTVKESQVTSFLYNLRNRNKSKANEKI